MKMAYIRWGEELPSGDKSTSFVFGDPDGLINMNNFKRFSYSDVRKSLSEKSDEDFKTELGRRLNLVGDELEIV